MRICYFVPRLGLGGAERRVVVLANAAVRRGHDVALVTIAEPGEPPEPCHPDVRLLRAGATARSGWPRLGPLLRRLRPEVFHGFLNQGNYLACPVARLAGVPVVIGGLGSVLEYQPRWLRCAARVVFALTDHATANSHGVLASYRRGFGLPAEKLSCLPNPIRVADWPCREAAARAAVRAELGLRPDEVAVATVGRLQWKKGQRHLIEAVALLAQDPAARFILVGDGEDRTALSEQVARLGVGERVRFVGPRNDLPRFLQGMDLLCLPSVIEGMPNVVLEAMAAGLPTVATAVAGATELVVPGVTGWLVAPGDPAALAAGLAAALRRPERLPGMGLAARRRVTAHYGEAVVVAQYLALYAELLERSSRRRLRA